MIEYRQSENTIELESKMSGSGSAARTGAVKTRSESRQRTALVALRLLPHERDSLARAAHSRGITLSELIRSSAMKAVSGGENGGCSCG